MRTMVLVLTASCALCACSSSGDFTTTTGGEAGQGGGGAGGAGGSAGGSGPSSSSSSGGSEPIPWDGAPYLGWGYNGSPCAAGDTYVIDWHDNTPSLAVYAVHVPVEGFITRATVVQTVSVVGTACTASARQVLISDPVDDAVPMSPGVREAFDWNSEEIYESPLYPSQGSNGSTTHEMGRDLTSPMPVHPGQWVYVASVLAGPEACAVGCDAAADGSPLPEGSFLCTVANDWTGCGPLDRMALPGWVDFADL